jgi:hypothetical protein
MKLRQRHQVQQEIRRAQWRDLLFPFARSHPAVYTFLRAVANNAEAIIGVLEFRRNAGTR